jgi:hypothetical protein
MRIEHQNQKQEVQDMPEHHYSAHAVGPCDHTANHTGN